jgi:hypothetical protein
MKEGLNLHKTLSEAMVLPGQSKKEWGFQSVNNKTGVVYILYICLFLQGVNTGRCYWREYEGKGWKGTIKDTENERIKRTEKGDGQKAKMVSEDNRKYWCILRSGTI